MGPAQKTAQRLRGWELRDRRKHRHNSNLMLGSRDVPSVQEIDRGRSKSALRKGQGKQESIQEDFLEEMTSVLGLKDK